MTPRLVMVVLVAAGAALALRGPRLDQRPMHNDEAVNAVKCAQIWQTGAYKYDPNEHHGPSLSYATLAIGRLTGAGDFGQVNEVKLRLVTVVLGLGLILLLPLVADGLGAKATVWAALLTAVSPALVFYSRYYIHETLLAFFGFMALAAGWRYWGSRRTAWALVTGASVGLMHATKETFVLSLAAAGLALVLNSAWNRWVDASITPAPPRPINPKQIVASLGAWFFIWLLLFSSFFSNSAGLLDSVRTYLPWLGRAQGSSPHIHPWHFYLHRLLFFHVGKGPVWSEGLIFLLGTGGAFGAFARKGLAEANAGFVRFVALYTFALLAGYSLISYKTPWCLLSAWQGMILLAGFGAAGLVRGARRVRTWLGPAAAALLLAGAGQLGWQAWRAGVLYAADWRNPYVYAQTSPDLLNLVGRVESLAQVSPQGNQMLIKVMAPEDDYWPLPWYLRRFPRIGWWDHVPDDPFAPVMIVSAQFHAVLDEKKTHLMAGYFELRPQVFLELYVELDLWRAWLANHPPKAE